MVVPFRRLTTPKSSRLSLASTRAAPIGSGKHAKLDRLLRENPAAADFIELLIDDFLNDRGEAS